MARMRRDTRTAWMPCPARPRWRPWQRIWRTACEPTSWAEERPADALAALEQIRVELTFPYMHTSAFTNHVLERFLRAEALNVLGRHEEALRWYQSVGLWTHSYADLPFIAPSHLRRAEIYERLGDNAQAVEHYTRFLDLWKDADPELQPTVRDVQQRLAKLAEER